MRSCGDGAIHGTTCVVSGVAEQADDRGSRLPVDECDVQTKGVAHPLGEPIHLAYRVAPCSAPPGEADGLVLVLCPAFDGRAVELVVDGE